MLDWRWVFWINVPVGLAGTVLGWFVLPPTKDLPEDARFDWKGAILIAPALTALIAVLNEGYAWGVTSPLLVGCALAGVILLTLFIRYEKRRHSPSSISRYSGKARSRPGISPASCATPRCSAYSLDAVRVRSRLQRFRVCRRTAADHRSCDAGCGCAARRRALRPARPASAHRMGMLICIAALALLFAALDGAPRSLPLVMLALALFGIGQGLFISPNNSAIIAAAPASLTGEAGGLLNVMRSCGISIGVAAASSLLAWRLAVLTGSGHNTLHAAAQELLSASRDVIILLGSFTPLPARCRSRDHRQRDLAAHLGLPSRVRGDVNAGCQDGCCPHTNSILNLNPCLAKSANRFCPSMSVSGLLATKSYASLPYLLVVTRMPRAAPSLRTVPHKSPTALTSTYVIIALRWNNILAAM